VPAGTNTLTWTIPAYLFGNTIEANVVITDNAAIPPIANSVYYETLTIANTVNVPTLASSPLLPNTMDANTVITFTASNIGGTATAYTVNYILSNSITNALLLSSQYNSVPAGSNTMVWTLPSLLLGNTVRANVVVANAVQLLTSNSVYSNTLTINSIPSATAPSFSSSPITLGQSTTLSTTLSGGTGPFTVNFVYANGALANTVSGIPVGGTATFVFTPSSAATYTFYVTATDTGTATPNIFSSTSNAVEVNTAASTAIQNLGSSSPYSGAPGGSSGLPAVIHSGSCYEISNLTQYGSETVTLNGTAFAIRVNFITPTTAGVTVNNNTYSLSPNQLQSILHTTGYNYTIEMTSLSYIPIKDTINLTICSSTANPHAYSNTTVLTSSYNISSTAPITVNVPGTGVTILLASSVGTSAMLKVVNITGSSVAPPPSYVPVLVLNISTVSSVNVTTNITMPYPCSISSKILAPYKRLASGSWTPITDFAVNTASCTVTFGIPPDPIVGLFEYKATASTTSTAPTTIAPTTSATTTVQQTQRQANNLRTMLAAAIIVVIIIIILAALFYRLSKGKKKGGRQTQQMRSPKGNQR
jgi:hypothetical protein